MATKTDKKAAARPKRSKSETQAEFEAIEAVYAATGPADAKEIETTRARVEEVLKRVEGVSVETVVRQIAGLGLDVSRALADVAEKLTAQVQELAIVREAVAIERRELERLHKIDIAATTLDHLIEEHARNKQAFETEIGEARAGWKAEASQAERERREAEEILKKQRQREIEDYEYRKALERKKAQDKYDEDQRLLERKNAERQETLSKQWQQREAALKAQEDEMTRLRAEVAEFPARLARDIEAAAAEARRQVEAGFERQVLILKKDAEAETRMTDLRVKALEQSLAAGAAQIAALEKQLAEAKQQVQDIAVRAIDGASGARALGHINQIAMEQAKNRPQG
jgi:colicin import membrane protein